MRLFYLLLLQNNHHRHHNDEVDSYFATKANTMINIVHEDDLDAFSMFTFNMKIYVSVLFKCNTMIWSSSRENLSSGFLTKRDSNQSSQLQRLARKLKFRL